MLQDRFVRIIACCALGLFFAAGLAWYQTQQEFSARQMNLVEPLSDGPYGGNYTLLNGAGETVTNADFSGQFKLVFFGFTFCPAVCPAELAKLADVLETLGPVAKSVKPIFISVDPERDTPDVMKEYTAQFHESIIGLTGSRAQIDTVLDGFKIYASKVEMEGMDGYMVDHSSFLYFLGPNDRLLALFKPQDSAEDIVSSIQGWFGQIKS